MFPAMGGTHGHIAAMTGATTKIAFGFRATWIILVNTTQGACHFWVEEMGAGTSYEMTAAAYNLRATTGFTTYAGGETVDATTNPVVDKNGAALPDGSIAPAGIQLGTLAALNTEDDVVKFIVGRGDLPANTGGTYQVPFGTEFTYTDEDP